MDDKKSQNQERTHPRNNESSAGVQKDNGEKTEMVWARHEDGRRISQHMCIVNRPWPTNVHIDEEVSVIDHVLHDSG